MENPVLKHSSLSKKRTAILNSYVKKIITFYDVRHISRVDLDRVESSGLKTAPAIRFEIGSCFLRLHPLNTYVAE